MKGVWVVALLGLACARQSDQASTGGATSSTVTAGAAVAASTTTAATVAPDAPNGGVIDSSSVVTAPWTDTKQVMDTSLDAPNFQCAPKVVTRNDTITLRAEVPHGRYLAVQDPGGTFYFLTYPRFRQERSVVVVDPDAYRDMLILRFRSDIRSRPLAYGHDTLEPVFRKSGKYVFTIGENLETEYDAEDPNWHCTVEYRASR